MYKPLVTFYWLGRSLAVVGGICGLCLLPLGPVRAADYYVATTGDDSSGTGSIGNPWATIQKAADSMSAGDTCYIRGGNYHQETVIDNLDGTSGSPITFINYSNEVVTLDGSQPVGDLGATGWTQYSGNIYQTTLTGEVSQIFVDGEWMMLARWPNARFDDDSAFSWDHWAQGRESLSSPGHEYDAAAGGHDLAASGLNMSNAMAVLNLGNFSTKALVVTNHASGMDNFMYDPTSLGVYKTVNHYFFFDSKLNLLDAETEWYFDPATSNLYLWAPGGGLPTGDIRGKNMDNAFFISNSEYIEIKGLQFFAQTFRLDDCNNITVEDCDLAYPCFNKRTLGQRGEIFGTRIEDCTYISILNCSFAYTDGLVVKFQRGGHNTVENCLLHHLDYTVAHHSGNSGFLWFRTSEHGTFRRNTVYTCGASEGIMVSSDQLVELNDISDTGLLQSDGANVHLFQGHRDVDIVRNWFHNSRKPAIRLSDGPKNVLPAAPLMRTGRARNNVDFNSLNGLSFMVKGDEREIYSNLCAENIRLADDSGSPATSGIHANSISANNAVETWITLSPNSYGAPSGTHTGNWEGGLLGGTPLSDQVRDWENRDFRPRAGSDYVDAGVVIPGVTDGYLGAAPDIGAYEYGDANYWIPGRKLRRASSPVPPHGSGTVKRNADLMWLGGYRATSHDIYFGSDPGSLVFKGNQANNIFDPGSLVDGQTYFWRVDAVTPSGMVAGPVWSFTARAPVAVGTVASSPTGDTYVQDTTPDSNYGSATSIKLISQVSYGYNREGCMKFDVNVPGPIVSAKLVVHNSGTTWNRDVGIYSMTDTTWDENSVTWNSRPLIDGVLLDRKDVRNETWEEFDVSSGVVSNGLVSFGLLRDPLDTQRHLDSRESLYPPELRIEYRATLSPADHYADWRTGYDFDGKIDFLDDPDGDVHNNLVEYGLGGSPDDANDPSDMLPTVRHVVTGGVEGLDYVYRRRTDAAMRGLSYRIEECSDLRSAEWIAATFPELDTSPLEAGFETVTHRIPVSRTNGFFRLRIAIE